MNEWNHNIHYHPLVLRAVPAGCARALDVGCGQGLLVRELRARCGDVVGIDCVTAPGSGFVRGDVMSYPFGAERFDFISVVATLHHLPLRAALTRFDELLRPGGVLAVIGLYRMDSMSDYAWGAAGFAASLVLRVGRGIASVSAPLAEPRETLGEIRAACDSILPGGELRRLLLFRYSFLWKKAGPL